MTESHESFPTRAEMTQLRRIHAQSDKSIWVVNMAKVLGRLRALNRARDYILLKFGLSWKLFRALRKSKDAIMVREFLSD